MEMMGAVKLWWYSKCKIIYSSIQSISSFRYQLFESDKGRQRLGFLFQTDWL